MLPTVFQPPEIRDGNDNIVKQGTFGKNSPLSNSTNDGWIDYVANDLNFLYDLAKDEVVPVSALPASGDTNKTYLLTTNGKTYRWSGTAWVEISSSEAVGRAETAANLAEQWATKTDGTVADNEYSAKYYANAAQQSADDAHDIADDIADHLAQIDQNTGGVSANSKRIGNIEKLLQGNLYDYQTDNSSAYTKSVPTGAMPYAGLEQIGGKTVVMNQLVDSGTTAVSTISGHKYYTLIDGTASIVTADGTAITIVDDTADMVCDLTLMFGSGNEPSTTADFTAIFGATHYPYNAGTLLSAGVTEVESVGKNLADYSGGKGSPSNEDYYNTNKRIYTIGKYCVGLTYTNFYQPSSISNLSVTENNISFTSSNGSYGIGIPFNCVAGEAYSFSNAENKNMGVCWYSADGTALSFVNGVGANVIAPANAVQGVLVLTPNVKTQITYSNIQIEHGASVTAYSPVGIIATYPIPTAIRNLEGYGCSCLDLYNYIDFERKVYVQNVGIIDMGTLDFSAYSSPSSHIFRTLTSSIPNIKLPLTDSTNVQAVNPKYKVKAYTPLTSSDDGYMAVSAGTTNRTVFINHAFSDVDSFTSAMSGTYMVYYLDTPIETDISAYLTDDNLINVEAGGTLTFENQHGDDYQIPVPSEETYMIDLQEAVSNG